ncbi:MAG: hypothetical protein ACREJ5_29795 [Geminicoccaceae bacterium]
MGTPGSDKAVGAILKWSERDDWQERRTTVFADHFGPVLDDFETTIEEVIDVLGPGLFAQLLGCALEDFTTCHFEPDQRNVVDDYLKRRGWKESAPVRSYLRALQRSVMSAYEVIDTVPGSHVLVRDLIRGGEPIRIEDKLGSQDLIQWDRIGARLLEIKGRIVMSGGALRLTFDDAAEIAEEIGKLQRKLLSKIKRTLKQESITEIDLEALPAADAVLGEMAPLFSQTWLATMLERLLDQPLPEIRNFDGEPVQFCETRLPVLDQGSLEAIAARLDALAELTRDAPDRLEWTWLAPPSSARDAGPPADPALASRLRGLTEEAQNHLGWLRLEPDALMLATNSRARAERGRDLLAATLGPLVGPPSISSQTPAQALAEGGADTAEASEAQPSRSSKEQDEALHHVLDRHYRATLSAPVPALDGKTPKQAVRSRSGREKTARWLKYLENQTARRSRISGEPGYDFGWMWDALKLNDLRR